MTTEINLEFAEVGIKIKSGEYKQYVDDHINTVKSLWYRMWKHGNEELAIAPSAFWSDDFHWSIIEQLVACHDQSKYGNEEFAEYRQFFYPCPDKQRDKEIFRLGWNHHQKMNPHHWEHWVLIENRLSMPLPMPFYYVIEMLLDWTAMSVRFKSTPSEWYSLNKHKMLIHDKTHANIEWWLPTFDCLYNTSIT